MSVTLPGRTSTSSGVRRLGSRSVRAPTAENVPQQSAGRDPGVAVPSGAFGGGEGLEAVASAMSSFGDRMAVLAEKREKAETESYVNTGAVSLATDGFDDFLQSRASAPESPKGFTDALLARHQQRAAALVEQAPNAEARTMVAQSAERIGLRLHQRAALFEHDARATAIVRQTEGNLTNLETAIFRDPTQAETLIGLGIDGIAAAQQGGGLTAAKAAELRDNFRVKGRVSQVRGLIDSDPATAIESLRSGAFDEDLPATVVQQLQGEAQRRVDAQQAEVIADLKENVRDAVSVLDRGRVPEGLDALRARVKGTELAEPLGEAVEDRETVQEFTRKPVAEQAAELRRMVTAETTDRRTLARQQRMARAHAGLRKEIEDGNGLIAARDIGLITDLGAVDLQDVASLQRRASQARVASVALGVPVQPLLPDEVDMISDQLDKVPADAVTGILASLRAGLGEDAALAFVAKRPELGVAVFHLSRNPRLSREIVIGSQLAKQNPDVRPGKADRVPIVGEVVGNMFAGLPGGAMVLEGYQSAAASLYAARRVPGGNMTFDGDEYKKALREVMGGPVEFNDRMILPPKPGMDEGAVVDLVRGLNDQDLVRLGNGRPVFGDGKAFAADMFKSRMWGPEAQLVTAGPGRYLVFFPGLGFVQAEGQGPFVLDLGQEAP